MRFYLYRLFYPIFARLLHMSSKSSAKRHANSTNGQKIMVMNFSKPPSIDDMEAIAFAHLDNMPDELVEYCEDLDLEIEDLPDEALEADLDLDSPFDIFALYKSGAEISPGILSKSAQENDKIILFRRPILDYWCESYDDLSVIIRQVMVNEIGQQFDFSENEIDEMNERDFAFDLYPDTPEFV